MKTLESEVNINSSYRRASGRISIFMSKGRSEKMEYRKKQLNYRVTNIEYEVINGEDYGKNKRIKIF